MFLKEIKFIFSQVQENKDALQPSNPLVKKKRGKGRQLEAVSEVASAQTEAPYIDHTGMAAEATTPEANEVSIDNNIPENEEKDDDGDRGDEEYEPEGSGEEGHEGSSTTTEEGAVKAYIGILLYYLLIHNDIYKIYNS